ncbi:MAG: 5'-methylthioadenosine/adenosylhomocysteine nucleosidase [Clostridiales bacterium]|nr:5'-methylthioadenosine/adenosylhomocysteine nucleosidase [Clostridiales bacterium]
MKLGLICANDNELAPFLKEMEVEHTVEKSMLKFYEGKLGGLDVVMLCAGACKVNAAIATQILIDHFQVEKVINAGVAGGMDPKVKILDTVVATEVTYHDVEDFILTEFHPWMKTAYFPSDPELLKKAHEALDGCESKGKIYFGRMVTGEAFIEDEGRDQINEKFHPLSVDMETGAMAHACYINEIPFLSIRCITDTAEYSGDNSYQENLAAATEEVKEITMQVLRALA